MLRRLLLAMTLIIFSPFATRPPSLTLHRPMKDVHHHTTSKHQEQIVGLVVYLIILFVIARRNDEAICSILLTYSAMLRHPELVEGLPSILLCLSRLRQAQPDNSILLAMTFIKFSPFATRPPPLTLHQPMRDVHHHKSSKHREQIVGLYQIHFGKE